jgi:hypothetical protein
LACWTTASLRNRPQHHDEPVPLIDLQPIQNYFAGIRQQRPLSHRQLREATRATMRFVPIKTDEISC